MKSLIFILLCGCSTCDWIVDFGPGKSYCRARKSAEKLCESHGGFYPSSYNPVSITCKDGKDFHLKNNNKWEEN